MIYEGVAAKGSQPMVQKYQFLEPVLLTVQRISGVVEQVQMGIGDIVEVMEPDVVSLVVAPKRDRIPLKGGDFIIEFPQDMRYTSVD